MIRVNLEIIRHRYFVIDRYAYVLTQIYVSGLSLNVIEIIIISHEKSVTP